MVIVKESTWKKKRKLKNNRRGMSIVEGIIILFIALILCLALLIAFLGKIDELDEELADIFEGEKDDEEPDDEEPDDEEPDDEEEENKARINTLLILPNLLLQQKALKNLYVSSINEV